MCGVGVKCGQWLCDGGEVKKKCDVMCDMCHVCGLWLRGVQCVESSIPVFLASAV